MEDNELFAQPRQLRVRRSAQNRNATQLDPRLLNDPRVSVMRKPLFSRFDKSPIVNKLGEQRYLTTYLESYDDEQDNGRRVIRASNVLKKDGVLNVNRKPIPPDLKTIIRIPKKYPNGGQTQAIVVPGEKLQRYALTYWKNQQREPMSPEKKAEMKRLLNSIRIINNVGGKGTWAESWGKSKQAGPSTQADTRRKEQGIDRAENLMVEHLNSPYGFTVISGNHVSGGVTEKSVRDYLDFHDIPVVDQVDKQVANYYRRMRKGKEGPYKSQQDVLDQIRRFLSRDIGSIYTGMEEYRPTIAYGTKYKDI